jgi:glycosyltransferase involved in cell wall biosynthesis
MDPMKGLERLTKLIEFNDRYEYIVITPVIEHNKFMQFVKERKKFGQKINIYENISLTNMSNIYNNCGVLFIPSFYEGFEMVTLEALSCGLPVVGSNVGAISELYNDHFPGVAIVDPDNVQEVSLTLEEMMKNYENNIDEKRQLHMLVNDRYGIDVWENRILMVIGENR